MKGSDNIRELRLKLDLTQQEFAKKIGITQAILSRYEIGERKPAYETIMKMIAIARALGRRNITPEYIRPPE